MKNIQTVQWVCPKCSHLNRTPAEMKPLGFEKVVHCYSDDGGCDSKIALQIHWNRPWVFVAEINYNRTKEPK